MFLESKDAYINKLFDILNPLLPHYSEGGARLKLGYTGAVYSETVAEAEAFLRVLWGFAPFLAGGGNDTTFEEIYLKGLTNGTDPQSSESGLVTSKRNGSHKQYSLCAEAIEEIYLWLVNLISK